MIFIMFAFPIFYKTISGYRTWS